MASVERSHGGLVSAELRALEIEAAQVLDFSVNCNPYGPCLEVVSAIRAAAIERYPDSTAREARTAIGRWLDLDPARVVLGNGACELLWTLAHTLLEQDTAVVVVEPTFCEFRLAATRCGARVHEWRAGAANDFAIDLSAVQTLVREQAAEVLYLCTPNSPTGAGLPASEVAALAAANPQLTIVLDQSFLSLSTRHADLRAAMPANVVCVRSLTKDHTLAGLRVGYLTAAPNFAAHVEGQRCAWPTSAFAQAAAIAACHAADFVDRSRNLLLEDRARLVALLHRAGMQPLPSEASFLLVRTQAASTLRTRLLARHHILVRDCSSFGLPDYIRIAVRPEADCQRLSRALEQELHAC